MSMLQTDKTKTIYTPSVDCGISEFDVSVTLLVATTNSL